MVLNLGHVLLFRSSGLVPFVVLIVLNVKILIGIITHSKFRGSTPRPPDAEGHLHRGTRPSAPASILSLPTTDTSRRSSISSTRGGGNIFVQQRNRRSRKRFQREILLAKTSLYIVLIFILSSFGQVDSELDTSWFTDSRWFYVSAMARVNSKLR